MFRSEHWWYQGMLGFSHFLVIAVIEGTWVTIQGEEAREMKFDAIVFSRSSDIVKFIIACANNWKNFRYLAARAAKDPIVCHLVRRALA
jgi:hypothetical protein